MVSADDDMRPYTLMEHSLDRSAPTRCAAANCARRRQNGYGRKSFDILGSFLDVLGKPVREVPDNYERGELLVDTAMDLETNATKGLARENSLLLQRGAAARRRRREDGTDVPLRARTTSTRSTSWTCFSTTRTQINADDLNDLYVLVNFRPVVTKKNWRMDCGVAGYDNTFRPAAVLPDAAAVRGLHLPSLDPAGGDRRRACRRGAEPHEEQLHAEPAGGGDLQRGGVQPAQAQDQGRAVTISTN